MKILGSLPFLSLLFITLPVMSADFQQHTVTSNFTGPAGISSCDVDGDGHLDLIGAGWGDDMVAWWRNSGEVLPSWEQHLVADILDGASFVCGGDLNSDGYPDIGASSWYDGVLMLFLGDGGSSWVPIVLADDFQNAHEIHFVDLDQDGLTDVLAAGGGNAAASWWRNDGSSPETWVRQDICTTMPGGRSVCWADFDGDGDFDVAGCALDCDNLRWWENGGQPVSPSWTEHVLTTSLDGAHMVRSADLDLNGFPDLASVACMSGQIGVWLNTGSSWEEHSLLGSFGIAMGLELALVNNDSLPDLVATSMSPASLSVWMNSGSDPEGWIKEVVDGTLVGGWPLTVADLDSDGKNDLVGGANSSSFIRWYCNQIPTGIHVEGSSQHILLMNEPSPNPSSGSISLTYSVPEAMVVSGTIIDTSGRIVRHLGTQAREQGEHILIWDGCSQAGKRQVAGLYFMVLVADGERHCRKIALLR